MHQEPSRGVAVESDHLQLVVLEVLLTDEAPGLWSTRELAQAVGDPVITADAISALHASGLVHLCEEFVFPTRAAACSARLHQSG